MPDEDGSNITRIHEDKEPVEGEKYVVPREAFMKRMEFYNPYSSREEYNMRQQRFLEAQRTLFSEDFLRQHLQMVGVFDAVFDQDPKERIEKIPANMDDIGELGMTGIFYQMGPKQYLEITLADRVFGDWTPKADIRLYTQEELEKNEVLQEQFNMQAYLFQPGQLVFLEGRVMDQKKGILGAHTLKKEHLSEKEIAEAAKKAVEQHDIFEFSNVHYLKMNRVNPLEAFLNRIIELTVKIDPSTFPDKVHEGEAYGWFEGNDYVPSGLSVENPIEEGPHLLLGNCVKSIHEEIIRPGDRLRYVVFPFRHHDYHYRGRLIDIVESK